MITIKAEVLKNKQRSDGTYNVKIRITYKREVKRLSTSIYVRQEDLTKSFKLKNPIFTKEADKLVRAYQETCASLSLESSNYSLDDIVTLLQSKDKKKDIDFIQYSRSWLEATQLKGKANYQTSLNAFIAYIGKEKLNTNQISKGLLEGFIRHLQEKRERQVALMIKKGKRIPSNRMVSLYLGCIRHLFNEAKKTYNDYDRNIIPIPNSPFENLVIPKQEATRKRAISAEDIKKIWKLPYSYYGNGKEKKCPYNLAKDCFIMSFCLMGMNSSDLYNCTTIEEGYIIYNRTKTKDRRMDKALMKVEIPIILEALINKYKDNTGNRVFKFYKMFSTQGNFNKAINLGLKEIGKKLGIEDLEYYAARHSWATLAVNKVGIDKYTVHAALNHLDEAMKVTDIYIERDFMIENEANRKVLYYVFG